MRYQGIIFDLDGVICTTDHYHYLAWKALADRLGIPFNEKDNNRLRGVSRMASLEIILEKSDKAYTQEEKEAMATEKNDTYRQLLHQITTADLSQEVQSTLDQLRAYGGNTEALFQMIHAQLPEAPEWVVRLLLCVCP